MNDRKVSIPTYHIFGLNIKCQLQAAPLFGLVHSTHEKADAIIRKGKVPCKLDTPIFSDDIVSFSPGCILLKIREIANYLIRDGKEIIIETAPHAKEGDVATYTFGSALGALLYQRGILALHGSAIRTKKGAVIFSGQRGAGKSTTAAALSSRGWEFMCDDVCAVHTENGNPILHTGLSRAKLASDSFLSILGHNPAMPPVSHAMNKYGVSFPTDTNPSALYSICTLQTTSGSPYIEKINGTGCLSALNEHIYRYRMYHYSRSAQERFIQCSQVASHTIFLRVFRPLDYSKMDRFINLLETYVLR